MTRQPRMAFGEVADLYDRVRPAYPDALVADVVDLSGVPASGSALEVGAGTGKATEMFARRGVAVHAIEPSAEMAAFARSRCAKFDSITFEQCDFEDWRGPEHEFALVFSAQAWHWVAPEVRCARARAALRDGGLLAVFWNRPDWDRCELRDELRDTYARAAPDFGPDPGPVHPGSEIAPDRWEDWEAEIGEAAGLEDPAVRFYESTGEYGSQRYVELIGTSQDHILLPDDTREALYAAVADVIDRHGGTLTLPIVTKLCLARAVPGGDR